MIIYSCVCVFQKLVKCFCINLGRKKLSKDIYMQNIKTYILCGIFFGLGYLTNFLSNVFPSHSENQNSNISNATSMTPIAEEKLVELNLRVHNLEAEKEKFLLEKTTWLKEKQLTFQLAAIKMKIIMAN